MQQPTSSDDTEDLFNNLVQRDMSGVYKQFGGLGTAAGRRMYAMYNKEESAKKRAEYRMELGTTKPQPTPDELHHAKLREKYAREKQKKSYVAPLPPINRRNSRPLAPVHFIPHRKSQQQIEKQMQHDFADQYDGIGVRSVNSVDRDAEKRRLQDRMASPSAAPARVGVRVDYTRPPEQPQPRVRAGQVAGRRSEQSQLSAQILREVREREAFLEEMRALNGPDYLNQRVDEEIRARLGELRRLEELGEE